MKNKVAYRIKNIEEFGKLMAYCIEHDISVWRTYWDERAKDDRCYNIDWAEKRCWYGPTKYYAAYDYMIIEPIFEFDEYGNVKIRR